MTLWELRLQKRGRTGGESGVEVSSLGPDQEGSVEKEGRNLMRLGE